MMRARISRPRWSVPRGCTRPRSSCQPGGLSRWPMSCSRGSKGESRGAKTAATTTMNTTTSPKRAVRRRTSRRTRVSHSRSEEARGTRRTTVSAEAGGLTERGTRASPEPDARVEGAVEEVDDEVHDDEGRGEEEDRRLH